MKAPQHEIRTDAQRTVAANVRAELSRERWSGRKAADALGFTQPYLSRRLSGDLPFDVNDLTAIAGLLNVPVTRFFGGMKKAPAVTRTTGASGVSLPDLDSNQEPAVSSPKDPGRRQYKIRRRPTSQFLEQFADPYDIRTYARRNGSTGPKNRPAVPRSPHTTADLYAA